MKAKMPIKHIEFSKTAQSKMERIVCNCCGSSLKKVYENNHTLYTSDSVSLFYRSMKSFLICCRCVATHLIPIDLDGKPCIKFAFHDRRILIDKNFDTWYSTDNTVDMLGGDLFIIEVNKDLDSKQKTQSQHSKKAPLSEPTQADFYALIGEDKPPHKKEESSTYIPEQSVLGLTHTENESDSSVILDEDREEEFI